MADFRGPNDECRELFAPPAEALQASFGISELEVDKRFVGSISTFK
jgi:hypothetical protein